MTAQGSQMGKSQHWAHTWDSGTRVLKGERACYEVSGKTDREPGFIKLFCSFCLDENRSKLGAERSTSQGVRTILTPGVSVN